MNIIQEYNTKASLGYNKSSANDIIIIILFEQFFQSSNTLASKCAAAGPSSFVVGTRSDIHRLQRFYKGCFLGKWNYVGHSSTQRVGTWAHKTRLHFCSAAAKCNYWKRNAVLLTSILLLYTRCASLSSSPTQFVSGGDWYTILFCWLQSNRYNIIIIHLARDVRLHVTAVYVLRVLSKNNLPKNNQRLVLFIYLILHLHLLLLFSSRKRFCKRALKIK